MNIIYSVSGSGPMDTEDRRAAILAINRYNDLKGTALPTDTAPNIRASYITVLSAHIVEFHALNVANSKTTDAAIKAGLTEAQQAEILGAVVDRLLNKESYATILADVQTP